MSKAVPLLLVATVITSIACMHLVRELRTEKARGDALQSRIVELERTAARPTPRATPFSAAPSESAPADAEIQAEPPAPPTTVERSIDVVAAPLDRAEHLRRHFDRQRERLQDPEYRDAMRVQHRLGLESSYPHIASELGLSEQEADQFLDLLAEHQVRGMEQRGGLFFPGERPDEAAMLEAQQLAHQRHRQQQTELETLLGATKYQKWQEYQQTLGQRHRVASMQSSLAMGGAPLDAEQSKALLSALVEEQRKQQTNAVAQGIPPMGALSMDGPAQATSMASSGLDAMEEQLKTKERSQQRLLSSLESTLTAQQITHLQDMFEREIEMQRAHLKMRRAQDGDQPNSGFFTGSAEAVVGFSPGVSVATTVTSEDAPQE